MAIELCFKSLILRLNSVICGERGLLRRENVHPCFLSGFLPKLVTPIVAVLLLMCLVHVLPVQAVSPTLAEQIEACTSAVDWGSPDTIFSVTHFGQVFSKLSLNAYDQAFQALDSNPVEKLKAVRLAEIDGYTGTTWETAAMDCLNRISMVGGLPMTSSEAGGVFHVYYRYVLNGYQYAEELNYQTEKWNKTEAFDDMTKLYDLKNAPFLYGNPETNFTWYPYHRYYDDTAQCLNIFIKLSNLGVSDATAKADEVYDWLNDPSKSNLWNDTYYKYRPEGGIECETGPFNMLIANYYKHKTSLNYYPERCVSDLNYKLLAQGWNSPLWSPDCYVIRHAVTNPQKRMQNTLVAWTALQAYWPFFSNSQKSTIVQLLTGNPKAWYGMCQYSGLYQDSSKRWCLTSSDGATSDHGTVCAAMLLFLLGIVPDTGYLAIPLNEEYYEDFWGFYPRTHFMFDYSNRRIRIPVNAGTLKFQYGTNPLSWTFPYTGIYEVRFSSDWNNITGATYIEELSPNYLYLATNPSLPPSTGNIRVTTNEPCQTWYTFDAYISPQVAVSPMYQHLWQNLKDGNYIVYAKNANETILSKDAQVKDGEITQVNFMFNDISLPESQQTEIGENVTLTYRCGISLTFVNVTSSGITTLYQNQTGLDPPRSFEFAAEPPLYYDAITTANYNGTIIISVAYDDSGLTQNKENCLQLMIFNKTSGQWNNITMRVDYEQNKVYGETNDLLPFALLFPTVSADINADGIVDIIDISAVALAFNSTPSSTNWNRQADINNDNVVDIFDIVIVALHLGETGE